MVGDFLKKLFFKEWSTSDKVLCLACATVIGMLVGLFLAPKNEGIYLFSNNASNNGSYNGRQNSCCSKGKVKIANKKGR